MLASARSTSVARSLAGCLTILGATMFVKPAISADVSFQIVENETITSRLDFDKSEIDAEIVEGNSSGELVLQLKLPTDSTVDFENLTAANIGRRLRLVIDGTVIAEPTVVEPISGGEIWVSGGWSRGELTSIADKLR